MAGLNCVVVTPESTALDQKVDAVTVPLEDGELGIAPHHSPLIGRLGFGEMRLRIGEKQMRYYVDGGFVHVENDVVSVLTSRLLPAEKVDADAAEKQLEEALAQKAPTVEQMEIRERAMAQARGQLRVARRSD